MKSCTRCSKEKPLSQFYKNRANRDGLTCECKECRSKIMREYHAKNREAQRARSREWYIQNRESELVAARERRGSEPRVLLTERLATIEPTADGCRIWPGHLDAQGYGHWGDLTAHRAVANLAGIRLPSRDYHFHHKCENRACVALAHLQIVAASEHKALHLQEA